jgi:hypothetical protein
MLDPHRQGDSQARPAIARPATNPELAQPARAGK